MFQFEWTALEADTKMILSWRVCGRDAETANLFIIIWIVGVIEAREEPHKKRGSYKKRQ